MSGQQPHLLMGVRHQKILYSEAQLIAELERGGRPYADVSFKKSSYGKSCVASLKCGNLQLSEGITDPLTWTTKVNHQLSFLVPIYGEGTVVERGRTLKWSKEHQILQFAYANPLEITAERAHMVGIIPSISELNEAVSTISKEAVHFVEKLTTEATENHNGIFQSIDYYRQIYELLTIIQLAHGDEQFLKRIGIDSVLTRVLAEMLVAREGFRSDRTTPATSKRSDRAVEIICDHIANNIGAPLTIPGMEQLAGLTGRALNYAFQSRFNCSPQEWQRNYLLDEARRRLSQESHCMSVKTVAYELGFSSSSVFAAHYKRRFGKLPSETPKAICTLNSYLTA